MLVFCRECRHHREYLGEGGSVDRCAAQLKPYCINGGFKRPSKCRMVAMDLCDVKNAGNDCPEFRWGWPWHRFWAWCCWGGNFQRP